MCLRPVGSVGKAEGVHRTAIATQLGQDRHAPFCPVPRQFLHDYKRGAFAQYRSLPGQIKRPAGPFGGVILRRQNT